MKKRLLILFSLIAIFAALLAVNAFAAGNTVVYLKDGGEGNGSSPDSAFSTLTKCYDALDLSKDCTIVVCGAYTQSVNWVYHDKSGYDGSITFTSVYGGVDYRETAGAVYQFKPARFSCFGETRFENLDFKALGTNFLVVGQHNPVVIGEGVTMSGSEMTGGSVARAFCILGGYQSGLNDPPATSNEDTNITVLSGSKLYIVPFSRAMAGTYTGTANIHIGGTAQVQVLHGSSVNKDGVSLGDVKITIDGKPTIADFYGCTSNVTVNSYEFNWESGYIENFEWVCSNTPTKTITVTGDRVLNATAVAQKNSNFAAIAANFDEVNTVKGNSDIEVLENATVVYVKDSGTGNGESAAKATNSLESAFEALDLTKDCTIVICGEFTQSRTFNIGKAYTGKVTITSVYGGTDYRKSGAVFNASPSRFILYGETVFDNIDINATGAYFLVIAQHNPFTLGEGAKMTTTTKMSGSSVAKSFTIIGGYENQYGSYKAESDADTNITVLSGEKLYIIPFSRNILGNYTGTANINIGGNANVSVLHGSAAYPDNVMVGNVKVTIDDNAAIGVFYGCTQVTTASSYEFIWKSGTLTKFEWLCSATPAAQLTVNGSKLLRASDAVKATSGYAEIAKHFDITAGLDEVVETVEKLPLVNPKNSYAAARGLYMLNLAQGYDTTGTNFGLGDGLTRAQAIVQVIRFLGVEEEVKAGAFTHPFKDVPSWANNYVGYAYNNNITLGRSDTEFDTEGLVNEAQFLTFMLRAIGYKDAEGDFVWDNPFTLANSVGMIKSATASASFNRGDAFIICWRTLFSSTKSGAQVCATLIDAGVFTSDELTAASAEARTATEPKKETVDNTPKLDGYNVISVEDYKDKTQSGFLAQFVGFLSGYEFAYSNGKILVAMPDDWFELCNGPYAEHNDRNVHEDKHILNQETGVYEVWNDDDFSIDILNQYILQNMYNEYGTFATKKITDGWVDYDVWDMGGGHRSYGAYGLMSKHGYLAHFAGSTEYGNMYNVNGEPYIANETLGMSAAGMPNVAVDQAEIFGGVTSDRDPTLWLKYFTAMISMAYFEDDVPTLMREAQKVLPDGCYQNEIIDRMFELYEKYPDDWRRAAVIAESENHLAHYDLDSTRGETSINCSFMLLGLLWGEGDYYETCKIISLAGHGGDSTTPGALTIVAIITGWDGLDEDVKAVVNERVWQDGKGVVVNRPAAGTSAGVHMYCAALPERIYMADMLEMYQANFEKILVENGGFIKDGYYYIPTYELDDVDTAFTDDVEDGSLDIYKTKGTTSVTETAYSGDYSAQANGDASSDSEVYAVVDGLTVGKTYRASAFISTTASTTAYLFARESGKDGVHATVYDQTAFVKRELEFTATASTMEIGITVPKGTSTHRYAVMDELTVVAIDEKSAGSATITGASANGLYTGTVSFSVSANTDKEVYLKLSFANTEAGTVNTKLTVDGAAYAGVPFYKTGTTAENAANTVYIPLIAKDKTEYTVEIDLGSSSLYIYSAELVDKMY